MTERIFLHLLNMSFTGGIVILAVLLLRMLLKKLPRKFSLLLWAVVLFRLLCPFTLESDLSFVRVNPTPLTEEIITSDTPQVNTGLPVVDDVINGALTDTYPDTPTVPPQNIPQDNLQNNQQNIQQNPPQNNQQNTTPNTPQNPPVTTPEPPAEKVSPWHVASIVWLCGIGVMAIYSVVSLWRLRRQLVELCACGRTSG